MVTQRARHRRNPLRNRRQHRQRSRKILLVSVLLVMTIGMATLYTQAVSSPRLSITRVIIRGNRTVGVAELRKHTDLFVGENWLGASGKALQQDLARFPRIAKVRVYKFPFRALTVVICERQPYVNIHQRGRYYLVDRAGAVCAVQDYPAPRLPTVTGPFFQDVEIGRTIGELKIEFIDRCVHLVREAQVGPVRKYCVDQFGGLSLVLADTTLVRLGRYDLARKLTMARRTLEYLNRSGKTAEYIDIRSTTCPVYKPSGLG